MKRLFFLALLMFSLSSASTSAQEYRAIFWNLESGESDNSHIAAQMAAKGDIDFWGLSEVSNQDALDAFEDAIEAVTGIDYLVRLSEDGGSDRLAILYRSDRFTAVDYSGTAMIDDLGSGFFEVDSINVGGTVRPALGIQLETNDRQQIVLLVNHWKCCGGASNESRRAQQAIQMNSFAIESPGIPIISGGDFNIPLNRGGMANAAFQELEQIWKYLPPTSDVGTHKGGTILDGVFVTNAIEGWTATTTILERDGNLPASSVTFGDNDAETDHRPVLCVVESDAEEHLQALKEAIADMEAALARMKAEVERMEGGE